MAAQRGVRSRSRALALQALYQWQVASTDPAELIRQFRSRDQFRRIDAEFFEQLLNAVFADEVELQTQLQKYADRDPAQLDPVGRGVLLIGLAELTEGQEPPKVVIDEAIELAKTYGPTDCHRFVNAVLDRVRRDMKDRE